MPSCNRGYPGGIEYLHTIELDRDEASFVASLLSMSNEQRTSLLFPVATREEIENLDGASAKAMFQKLAGMERCGDARFVGKPVKSKDRREKNK
jgi:hypothetical protein